MMEFDRAQTKRAVKLSMKSTRPNPILVTFLFSVIVSVGTSLINTVLGWLFTGDVRGVLETMQIYMDRGYDVEEALYIALLELYRLGPAALLGVILGGMAMSAVVYLWQSTMGVGYEGWCLSMARNENPPLGKLFGALPMFGQVLVTRVLTGIFQALWALLALVVCLVVFVAAAVLDIPVISVLLAAASLICAVLGVIWVTMRYALVDYVLLDKGLSGMEAIQESKRMMRANTGRGFMLQLSFIGWGLLILAIAYAGILVPVVLMLSQLGSMEAFLAISGAAVFIAIAAFIGMTVLTLWLRPYITGCWAGFYDWARGAADGFSGGPGYGNSGGWGGYTGYTRSDSPNSGTGTGRGTSGPDPWKPRDDPWN